METLVRIAIALTSLALQGPGSLGPPLPAAAEVVRAEHFVIELAQEGARPIGVAVWRRSVERGATQLEWEIRFHEAGVPDTRVLHVERHERGRSKLVWRSWRPGQGRTLIVEQTGGDTLRVLEWGRSDSLREELEAGEGAVMPLQLQQLARDAEPGARLGPGLDCGGRYRLFDPLSRRFERVRVDCLVDAAAPAASADAAPARRRIELRRDDDTLAAAWVFDGEGLREFQWQAGGLRGRRVSADDYRRRLKRMQADGEEPRPPELPDRE